MIGEKIKKLRLEKGIYQQELASALQVSKSTIAMWETNKRAPELETAIEIATYFDVSLDYLLGKTKYRNRQEYLSYYWDVGIDEFEAPFDFCKTFVKEERTSKGIEPALIAKAIGLTENEYLYCERGDKPISYKQAQQICNCLNTSIEKLIISNFDKHSNNMETHEIIYIKYEGEGPIVRALSQLKGENDFLKKYRALDEHGKKIVNFVADEEYKRCVDANTKTIPYAASSRNDEVGGTMIVPAETMEKIRNTEGVSDDDELI